MDRWSWEVMDLAGATRTIVSPRQVAINRKLNGASTVMLVMDAASDAAELTTTARLVRGWRSPASGGARVVRATGKVSEVSVSGSSSTLEQISVFATDGFGWLSNRLLQDPVTYTGLLPGEIVEAVIDLENARGSIGLTVTGDGGSPRDRQYDRGKNCGDLVNQLAEVDDGFYYRVDPTDAVPGVFSELVLLYPSAGTDSDASFEFGPETRGNLASYQYDIRPPVNAVMASGAGDGDEQLRATRSDALSIASYGLYDRSVSHPDVIIQTTLEAHAEDALRPDEAKTFRFQVAPAIDSTFYVPSPWDDFDVGDTVTLNIQTPAVQFQGRVRVDAFTVAIDANGVERIASLDLGE